MKLKEIKAMLNNTHPLKGKSMGLEVKLYSKDSGEFYLNIRELSAQEYLSANIGLPKDLILNRSLKSILKEFESVEDFEDFVIFQIYYKSFEIPFMLGLLNLNTRLFNLICTKNDEIFTKEILLIPADANKINLELCANTTIPKIYWDDLCDRILSNWQLEEENREQKEIDKYLEQEYMLALTSKGLKTPYINEIKMAKKPGDWEPIIAYIQDLINSGTYKSISDLPKEYKHPNIITNLCFY